MGQAELDKVLALPAIKRRLAKRPTVIRIYDLPYLGGYSQNGKRIYLDRHLRPVRIGRKIVDATRYVVFHEWLEKAIEDVLNWKYPAAHELATAYEHRYVRKAGLDPKQYETALRPQIKADEHERLVRIPPDLDLKPYDGALLKHLKRMMGK